MSKRTLAIIPARGGSKRIPKKNIKEVGGKPLIAHTIEHAKQANQVDTSVVSTEDDEISRVAREHGGNVPFNRPAELATDMASSSDVVTHALEWYEEQGEKFDIVCTLQVTSPLRAVKDIDGALDLLSEEGVDSVITVSEYVEPPQWAVTEGADGYLEEYYDSGALWGDNLTRSQDIPSLQYPNGALFAATVDAWQEYETFYAPRTRGYKMPPKRSFDIDEPWELELVRALLSY